MSQSSSRTGEWSALLRQVRKSLRLSRAALAERAGVSAETVKAYELGLRHPSRALLTAILDATKIERGKRWEIFQAAGFAPDSKELGPERFPDYLYTPEEAQAHCNNLPWPAFVTTEYMEVAHANTLAQKLWAIDLEAALPDTIDRNLLKFASDPRFADRLENWDEAIKVGIGIFKGHHRGGESLDAPSSYFSRFLDDLLNGDLTYIGRLVQLWGETLPRTPKVRWTFPVTWREPDIGRIRMLAVITPCNEELGTAFNDWFPVDAESWANLEQVRGRDLKSIL
jgi:transcriptional regulator with XRE-family HTH domain